MAAGEDGPQQEEIDPHHKWQPHPHA